VTEKDIDQTLEDFEVKTIQILLALRAFIEKTLIKSNSPSNIHKDEIISLSSSFITN
tara:strand:- start:17 stop:187 length:171 start_codon:yes stop_codon:yes gene_type:complete